MPANGYGRKSAAETGAALLQTTDWLWRAGHSAFDRDQANLVEIRPIRFSLPKERSAEFLFKIKYSQITLLCFLKFSIINH